MERKIEFTPKKILFYVLGFLIVGLAVNIMARSDLGLGAWDTVTFNLNAFQNKQIAEMGAAYPITRGTTSMFISLLIMLFVIIYNRRFVFLFMLIPIFAIGLSIDFWDLLMFKNLGVPDQMVIRVLYFIVGMIILPLGLASIVTSHFPAFVFDEWTLTLMTIFKTKSITKVRLGIEVFGICLGILFGLLAGIGFGYVSYGSVIIAFTLPPMFNYFVTVLGKL